MHRVSVEVCCTSLDEALAADAAGADNIELCSWLACGGLTPSMGLVLETMARVKAKVRVLVRSVPGGFTFSGEQKAVMLRDVEVFSDMDLGLVVGALDMDGWPDRSFMRVVMAASRGKEITFHRAVDVSKDPVESSSICRDLGVHRILSSGGAVKAIDGMDNLRKMIVEAGSMDIAAGAGISDKNVLALVSGTGVKAVHFSAQLSTEGPGAFRPDVEKINDVLQVLARAGLR